MPEACDKSIVPSWGLLRLLTAALSWTGRGRKGLRGRAADGSEAFP